MPTSFLEDLKPLMSRPGLHLVQLAEIHCLQESYSAFIKYFQVLPTFMTLCIHLNHFLEFLCVNVANICCKSDIKQLRVSIFTNENLFLHGGSSILQNYFLLLPVILNLWGERWLFFSCFRHLLSDLLKLHFSIFPSVIFSWSWFWYLRNLQSFFLLLTFTDKV